LDILLLFLNDMYHLIESVAVKPLYLLVTGRNFRIESYEELGYYKLRRMSEIFAETVC